MKATWGLAVVVLASCSLFGSEVAAEWKLAEAPNGRTLVLRVALGVPCNDLSRVDVSETDETVSVEASVRVSRGGCDDAFGTETVEVELDEPLGDRVLTGCMPPVDGDVIRFGDANPDCAVVDS